MCRDIIEILDTNLIPAAADAEPKVVFASVNSHKFVNLFCILVTKRTSS